MSLIYTATSSKRKKRGKTLSKAQKALADQERAMLDKWAAVPKLSGKYASAKETAEKAKEHAARVKERAQALAVLEQQNKAASTYTPGVGAAKPVQHYTGTKILGLATMHKSSIVPVFSEQEAVEVATMRRN